MSKWRIGFVVVGMLAWLVYLSVGQERDMGDFLSGMRHEVFYFPTLLVFIGLVVAALSFGRKGYWRASLSPRQQKLATSLARRSINGIGLG